MSIRETLREDQDRAARPVFRCLLLPGAAPSRPVPSPRRAITRPRRATPRSLDFCERLAKQSPLVRLGELGTSGEGRKLPLLILADPPIATPEEAAKSKKLVVFAIGNIHAGEVDGKEALLMLARDIALAKERPLLKDLVIVFAPIFNADGNEKIGKNRPDQAGPGDRRRPRQRPGAGPQSRFRQARKPRSAGAGALLQQVGPGRVRRLPHDQRLVSPLHADLRRAAAVPPATRNVIGLVRDEMLPDMTKRLEKKTGYKSYFYGNFSPDRSRWETVPATPRYGTHYVGLRNRIAHPVGVVQLRAVQGPRPGQQGVRGEHLRIHRREQGQDSSSC